MPLRKEVREGVRYIQVGMTALLCIVILTGCSLRPHAITIGQQTMIIHRGLGEIEDHLLEVHEAVHRSQYANEGTGSFLWRYLSDAGARLTWEAEAYSTAICRARELGAPGWEIDRLRMLYSRVLRDYVRGGSLTQEAAGGYIDAHYRDGIGCDLIDWESIPSPDEEVLAATALWRRGEYVLQEIHGLLSAPLVPAPMISSP